METDKTYIELLTELKKKIRQAQQRIAFSLNTEMLVLYWSMGNEISAKIKEAEWGAKVINQLPKDLRKEFPDRKGFSVRNLKYRRSFADAYPDFLQEDVSKSEEAIVQPPVAQSENTDNQQQVFVQGTLAQLTWYHHITLKDFMFELSTGEVEDMASQMVIPNRKIFGEALCRRRNSCGWLFEGNRNSKALTGNCRFRLNETCTFRARKRNVVGDA